MALKLFLVLLVRCRPHNVIAALKKARLGILSVFSWFSCYGLCVSVLLQRCLSGNSLLIGRVFLKNIDLRLSRGDVGGGLGWWEYRWVTQSRLMSGEFSSGVWRSSELLKSRLSVPNKRKIFSPWDCCSSTIQAYLAYAGTLCCPAGLVALLPSVPVSIVRHSHNSSMDVVKYCRNRGQTCSQRWLNWILASSSTS